MPPTHHLPDHRSGLVFQTHELKRQAGARKEYHRVVDAPDGIGGEVIKVPAASPIELSIALDSVSEGVLVSGTATVQLTGECVRCLEEVSDSLTVDLQELYVYPESDAEEDEAERIIDHMIDLEPLVRDQVVLELPFTPMCRQDCRGLCVECGANLNADPDHAHEKPADARWAALQQWQSSHVDNGGNPPLTKE